MAVAEVRSFNQLCRHWRKLRKLSQLDLALAADVSQRHVSWLETGRANPSREMVVKLSEALHVPLRERNVLLQAAGFVGIYRETELDDPTMAPVLDALTQVLEHHEPLPAVVIDRYWNLRKTNQAGNALLALVANEEVVAEISRDGLINLAHLTVHPDGLRKYMTNWPAAAPLFLRRLRQEAALSGDPRALDAAERLAALAGDLDEAGSLDQPLLPVLPIELQIGPQRLALFTMISTIGTPLDITTDELRLESFYPADAATAEFFASIAT